MQRGSHRGLIKRLILSTTVPCCMCSWIRWNLVQKLRVGAEQARPCRMISGTDDGPAIMVGHPHTGYFHRDPWYCPQAACLHLKCRHMWFTGMFAGLEITSTQVDSLYEYHMNARVRC